MNSLLSFLITILGVISTTLFFVIDNKNRNFFQTSTPSVLISEKSFPNILDRYGSPNAMRNFDSKLNQKFNPLFDQGSWHGFLLPLDKEDRGSFTGPMIVAEEYSVFMSNKLEQLHIFNSENGKIYNFSDCYAVISSFPGVLKQKYEFEDIIVETELRFVSNRTALIKTKIKNKMSQEIALNIEYSGQLTKMWTETQVISDIFPEWTRNITTNEENGIEFNFGKIRMSSDIMLNGESSYLISRSLYFKTTLNDLGYTSELTNVTISPLEEFTIWSTQSYFIKTKEKYEEYQKIKSFLANGEKHFNLSEKKWNAYLNKALAPLKPDYSNKLIIKSIETLLSNWRGAAGQFFHDCVIPSVTSRWFNGMWAWDTWKHAAALSYFNADLAKDNIRSMYDHQIQINDPVRPNNEGMIIDCIFYNTIPERGGDGHNWNERNAKPPLSVWAAWKVYEQNADIDFLKEMYSKLVAFHKWWFSHRDCNGNGVAEYGGTTHPVHNDAHLSMKYSIVTNDSSLTKACNLSINKNANSYECVGLENYNKAIDSGNYESINAPVKDAASWESGMDNAARFGHIEDDQLNSYARNFYDGDVQKARKDWELKFAPNFEKNRMVNGFSINQESVDLNSFLYYEKILLGKIAKLLGYFNESKEFLKEADFLQKYINKCMWDAETGFYYDRQIDISHGKKEVDGCWSGNLLTKRGRGTESLIPLWVNISTTEQAEKMKKVILNITEFNGFLPFPSASMTSPAYGKDIYWRGRVWLDQVYFGVIGLMNYGFRKEAVDLMEKTFNHAESLLGNGTFRENYDPELGVMDDATNFGWTAAHVFLLLKEMND